MELYSSFRDETKSRKRILPIYWLGPRPEEQEQKGSESSGECRAACCHQSSSGSIQLNRKLVHLTSSEQHVVFIKLSNEVIPFPWSTTRRPISCSVVHHCLYALCVVRWWWVCCCLGRPRRTTERPFSEPPLNIILLSWIALNDATSFRKPCWMFSNVFLDI